MLNSIIFSLGKSIRSEVIIHKTLYFKVSSSSRTDYLFNYAIYLACIACFVYANNLFLERI
jgi:hypothetical protein